MKQIQVRLTLEHSGRIVTTSTAVLVALKLADILDWSWLWVFSPLWLLLLSCGVLVVLILAFPPQP
jgi:hypothetical protein